MRRLRVNPLTSTSSAIQRISRRGEAAEPYLSPGRADPARSAHFTFFRRRLFFIFSFASQPHRHTADMSARRAAEPYLSPVGGSSRVRPTIFL